jgi:hypothetical protein
MLSIAEDQLDGWALKEEFLFFGLFALKLQWAFGSGFVGEPGA